MCIYDIKNDCVAWSGKSRDGKTNKQVCIGKTDKWSPICQVIPMHSWEDCLSASNSPWHPFVLWRWERHGVLDAWRLFYVVPPRPHSWQPSLVYVLLRERHTGGESQAEESARIFSGRHLPCFLLATPAALPFSEVRAGVWEGRKGHTPMTAVCHEGSEGTKRIASKKVGKYIVCRMT